MTGKHMQGIAQWQSAQPTDKVQRYLNRLDDYDAPYMLIIQLNTEVAASIEILNTLITEFELDAECVEKLSDSVLFLALEYLSGDDEAGQIQAFAREFQTRLTALGILSHGAIVHHNCLGQAEQSFRDCLSLVKRIIDGAANQSELAIMDFGDNSHRFIK